MPGIQDTPSHWRTALAASTAGLACAIALGACTWQAAQQEAGQAMAARLPHASEVQMLEDVRDIAAPPGKPVEIGQVPEEELLEELDALAYEEMTEEEAEEKGYVAYTLSDGSKVWFAKKDLYSISAHDDGSLNEYEEGYFVAHSYTYYGNLIASLYPGARISVNGEDIVIDGSTYSNYKAAGSLWDIREAVGFDKVCFQTCVGDDGDVIVYYGHYADGSVPVVEGHEEYEEWRKEQERQEEASVSQGAGDGASGVPSNPEESALAREERDRAADQARQREEAAARARAAAAAEQARLETERAATQARDGAASEPAPGRS